MGRAHVRAADIMLVLAALRLQDRRIDIRPKYWLAVAQMSNMGPSGCYEPPLVWLCQRNKASVHKNCHLWHSVPSTHTLKERKTKGNNVNTGAVCFFLIKKKKKGSTIQYRPWLDCSYGQQKRSHYPLWWCCNIISENQPQQQSHFSAEMTICAFMRHVISVPVPCNYSFSYEA